MNEGFDLKAIAGWLLAGVMGVVAWFCRRDMGRYDTGLDRITALEKNSVTYTHLDRVLDQMRSDRADMHAENQTQLNRIEDKIDTNEEKSANSRHAIRDEVHALALKMAVTTRKGRDSFGV